MKNELASYLDLTARLVRGEIAPEAFARRVLDRFSSEGPAGTPPPPPPPPTAPTPTPTPARSEEAAPATLELPEVRLDLDRRRRCGHPEVIYAPGKRDEAIVSAATALVERGEPLLATRLTELQGTLLAQRFPRGTYNARARTFRQDGASEDGPKGRVCVVTAGTGDLPVAEEAVETLRWMNVEARLVVDVGVAGPQRLLERIEELRTAEAVIVVAGMEGALPSVVGGHLDRPVIGVPTSVGYGANFAGVSALLSMLNSCAANVTVVNIDAGFKAGYVAGMIARAAARAK